MVTTKYIINELSEQKITGDLKVTGNLSGSTFYGDGSNLTGVSGGFTGGTVSGATTFTNGVSGNTVSADKFYGDGSNIAGVVGLGYNDLGFTITSITPGINQDVVLPYNATVTYPTPLIMNNGYVLTIPSGTTLTII